MTKKTNRISITVPLSVKETIELLADKNNMNDADVIRNFILFGLTTESLIEMGYKIIAKDTNGNEMLIADSVFQVRLVYQR